jgi:hypothetical protein
MISVAILLGAEEETAIREMRQVLEFETKIANVSHMLYIIWSK